MAHVDFLRALPDTQDCILWPYAVADNGYGVVQIAGKLCGAHRAVLSLRGVPILGKVVRHTCDVRRCVNPRHLVAGSNAANLNDMANKGRAGHGRGLTDAQIDEAKRRVVRGCRVNGINALARELGVDCGNLSRILSGQRRYDRGYP